MKPEYRQLFLSGRTEQAGAGKINPVSRRVYGVDVSARRREEKQVENEVVKERLIKTLGELVKFRTIADGEHTEEMRGLFDYIDARVVAVETQIGKKFVKKEWNNNGHISMIISPADDTRSEEEVILQPKIALLIHADVIDAEDKSLFDMRQDGDTLYGRGTNDMKGPLAIGLDLLPELPVGVALIITSDEEIGGEHGAKYLARDVGVAPEFLINLDGQGSEQISYGSKGMLRVKITFNSLLNKGGHGSRGEDYSANSLGRDFENALEELYPWKLDEAPEGVTYNIGEKNGGITTNKIAQHAEYKIDMRFPTEEDKAQGKANTQTIVEDVIVKKLQQIYGNDLPVVVKTAVDIEEGKEVFVVNIENLQSGSTYTVVKVEVFSEIPVYTIDPQNRQVQRFVEILQEVTEGEIKFKSKTTSANDSNNWLDTPGILYVPKSGGAHSSNEWVSATSLVEIREATLRFMKEKK